MKLTLTGVCSITAHKSGLVIDCDMTEAQMFAALQEFCTRITEGTLDDWVRRIREGNE